MATGAGREAVRRAYLVEATALLASSLDIQATLASVARLAVPRIADWCAVDLVADDGEVERVEVAHVDPAKVELAREVARRWPPSDRPGTVRHAIRTGEPYGSPAIPDELLVSSTHDAEHLAIIRSLGLGSYRITPLRARGRVLGAISFVNATGRPPLDDHDAELADELAAIAAVALDNARLYDEAQAARRAAEAAAARAVRLQELAAALSNAATTGAIAEVIVTMAAGAVGAVGSGVWRLTGGGDALEVVSLGSSRYAQVAATFGRIPLDAAIPGAEAVRTRRPIYVRDHGELAAWPAALATSPADRPAFAVLPLVIAGRALGALAFSFAEPRAFPEEERAYLGTIAQLCAEALERALLYEGERTARAEAELAGRAREELMAIVSHDLRNPLGSIMTSAAMLEKIPVPGPPGDRVRKYASIIQRSSRRMNQWISDLLDLARLDGGRLAIEPAEVDGAALLREAIEMVAPVAAEKRLRLDHEVAAAALAVRCDRERIVQVLSNLLGNAIKFTPEGGRILAGLDAGVSDAVFSVVDDGPGIPEEQRAKIFERYWQARRSGDGGVGLGLSIAKGLVEAHGGRIWADARPGGGAAFYFTLPAATRG